MTTETSRAPIASRTAARRPIVAVLVVIFTVVDGALQVLLIERSAAPAEGRWAIPGGAVLHGETMDEAAVRKLAEETGVTDVFLSIPPLVLAMSIMGVLEPTLINGMLAVTAMWWPWYARLVYNMTRGEKEEGYVLAAELIGATRLHVIFREILPSVIPSLVVEASLRFSYAIFLVASLGFLGFRARPPSPDWGLMVNENRGGFYQLTPWALEFPALAIAILVIAVNLMSDGIRRAVQKGA